MEILVNSKLHFVKYQYFWFISGYINSKKQRKNDDSIPQKLMDDLFLKTKATPSIYWQPLSPEEVSLKC